MFINSGRIVAVDVERQRIGNADGVYGDKPDLSRVEVTDVNDDLATGDELRDILTTGNLSTTVTANSAAGTTGAITAVPTGSKADAGVIGNAPLRRIKDAVGLPMVAIGGVNEHNIRQLEGTGVDGIAVISALFGAEDVTRQAELLYALARRLGDRA